MQNERYRVTYKENGKIKEIYGADNEMYSISAEYGENGFTCGIKAKQKIELIKVDVIFDHAFAAGDKIFSNGYQAWTTSREYIKTDKMSDITPIAVGKKLRNTAGISADSRFVSFPKAAGEFYSHTYTYIKNNDKLFFMGSLTERQGFTVFYLDMNIGRITVSKDVEGVTLDNESYDLFDIFYSNGSYDSVFDAYFTAMKIAKPRVEHLAGYTSWYNYFQKIDENIIIRDLNALSVVKDSVNIFQVDDGYETFVGDWTDRNPKKFPKGMGYIADSIHKKGYLAGIWLAPFNVQRVSRTYKEHPDWVIKDANGNPLIGVLGWGGAYTLDMYNENARAYIQDFFNVVLHVWGYDMVKLDFLYSQCLYPRNNKSRGTIMCEAMQFLRECCGDKLILGCGVPLGAAFGYVDACRISCDVDLKYSGKFYNKLHINNEIPSAQNAINNAIFRRHLDGRVFCNDPDVFFLRYSNLDFNMEQKLLLGGINHMFGNVLFVSDNADEYKHNDVVNIRKLFSRSNAKIISADYVDEDVIVISAEIEGEKKTIRFNIKTGKGNMAEVLGLKQ